MFKSAETITNTSFVNRLRNHFFILCAFVPTDNMQRAQGGVFLVPTPRRWGGTGGSENQNGRSLDLARNIEPRHQSPLFRSREHEEEPGARSWDRVEMRRNLFSAPYVHVAHSINKKKAWELEETEHRKADRTIGVTELFCIFQYFVRHGLTSSGKGTRLKRDLLDCWSPSVEEKKFSSPFCLQCRHFVRI